MESSKSTADNLLMRSAIEAAQKSTRQVRPNPKVGAAILFKNGTVLADHHKKFGEAHAERELLKICYEKNFDTRGATMAVTLEPCSHFGKTPPCADALIEAQIARVLVGSLDPHPQVNGEGIKKLKRAGIEVVEGILAAECESLNPEWLQAHRQGFPFIRVKMATSIDGLWTAEDGDSRWITGPEARQRGHELRKSADALITGVGTIERDNPSFTARDSTGNLFEDQPKVIVLSRGPYSLDEKRIKLHPKGVDLADGRDLKGFFHKLYEQECLEVLVEAGPRLTQAILESGFFNEVLVFVAPKILGGQGRRLEAFSGGHLPGLELKMTSSQTFNSGDTLLAYKKVLLPGTPNLEL